MSSRRARAFSDCPPRIQALIAVLKARVLCSSNELSEARPWRLALARRPRHSSHLEVGAFAQATIPSVIDLREGEIPTNLPLSNSFNNARERCHCPALPSTCKAPSTQALVAVLLLDSKISNALRQSFPHLLIASTGSFGGRRDLSFCFFRVFSRFDSEKGAPTFCSLIEALVESTTPPGPERLLQKKAAGAAKFNGRAGRVEELYPVSIPLRGRRIIF
jgi:hypothetical protein